MSNLNRSYRIAGLDESNPNIFWAEVLDEDGDGTEQYDFFVIDKCPESLSHQLDEWLLYRFKLILSIIQRRNK